MRGDLGTATGSRVLLHPSTAGAWAEREGVEEGFNPWHAVPWQVFFAESYVGECEARALGMRIVELPAGSPSGFPVRYSWTSL